MISASRSSRHIYSVLGGHRHASVGGGGLLTLFSWQVVEVNLDREVVAGLDWGNVTGILPLEHFLSTITDEILVAANLDGYQDLTLGLGGRDVEDNTVEVGNRLVDVGGGSSEMARRQPQALPRSSSTVTVQFQGGHPTRRNAP